MLTKETLNQVVKSLPEKFSIDELLDKIVLITKVEHALKQSEEGNTITTEELKSRLEKWLK